MSFGKHFDPFGVPLQVSRRRFCTLALLYAFQTASAADLSSIEESVRPVRIGVLSTGHNDPLVYRSLETHLMSNLPDLADRLTFIRREAGFSNERLRRQTDELISIRPDVLICLDLTAALSAKTRRFDQMLPIVFLVHADPLAYDLVKSYAHPGNNITGVTTFRCVDEKMIEVMVDAFPKRRRIGYFVDTSVDDSQCVHLAEQAAARLGVHLSKINVASANFIQTLDAKLKALHLDAVIAPALAPLWQNRSVVVRTMNNLQLPVLYENDVFLTEGGLMSYGAIRTDAMPQVAIDVRKILSGEAAGDLPVEQPTLFELVINLRAPHATEYGVDPSALRRADRILE
jgi:putative tryptophan/tyrosine transport system substrate-binding protein